VNAARASQESKEKRNGQEKVVYKDNTYIYNRDSIKMDDKVVLEVSNAEHLGGEEEVNGEEKGEKVEKKKNSNKKNKKSNKKR
jgi:hypothetical protein